MSVATSRGASIWSCGAWVGKRQCKRRARKLAVTTDADTGQVLGLPVCWQHAHGVATNGFTATPVTVTPRGRGAE